MIKLRRFSLADLKKIMTIERISFPEPWSEFYFKNLHKRHPDGFFVAEVSKKVAGYAFGYRKPNDSGSIKTIAVAPRYRQQGIGTKLINFTINKLKRDGVREVFLHSRTKNKTAELFYKKLGFKVIKIVKKYFRNGDDASLMRKKI